MRMAKVAGITLGAWALLVRRFGMSTAFGSQLKHWRSLRRMSQLDLSLHAGVSARHLSFLETGRSRPRQNVILRLAEALDVPLRDRNDLLRSVGLPIHYPEARLSDESLAPYRNIIDQMLSHHAPYPGFVLDRWWNMTEANAPARQLFLGGRDLAVDGPVNMLDWMQEPAVRQLIVNWDEALWAGVQRLRREVDESGGDARLSEFLARALAVAGDVTRPAPEYSDNPVLCIRLRVPLGDGTFQELSVLSTIARFGTTREITLDELRIELVFPADETTAEFFRQAASQST